MTENRTIPNKKNRRAIAAINTPLPSLGPQGDAAVVFIFQNGRCLEDYIEEFLDTCHLACCNDVCLMEEFCYRLDDDICFVMPRGDPCWTLKSNINFALWMKGSAFTVDEADVEDFISIQPHHTDFSQRGPQPSLPSSPRNTDRKPEPTAATEPELVAFKEPGKETELYNTTEPEPNVKSDQEPVP